jgi:hypothetical protein
MNRLQRINWLCGRAIGTCAVALLVSACGSLPTPPVRGVTAPSTSSPRALPSGASSTPSSTVSPGVEGSLASCVDPTLVGSSLGAPVIAIQAAGDIQLLDLRGDRLNEADATNETSVGLGPDGVYLYDSQTGQLSRLGLEGPLQPLVTIPGSPDGDLDLAGLAESPNGRCWIYSVVTWDQDSGSATTRLYVGGASTAPVLLGTYTRGNTSEGRYAGGYRVLAWTASGVLLGTDPSGVGGAGPFIGDGYSRASVVELNPVTGTLSTSSLCPSGDTFGQMSADGSVVACVSDTGSQAQITLSQPAAGTSIVIPTGATLAGHVLFTEGANALTYCTGDEQAATDGSGSGWTETLWRLSIGAGSPPTPQRLMSGEGSWCEEGAVLDAGTMVEAQMSNGASTYGTVDLVSGQSTTIGTMDQLLGVL